MDYLQLGHFKNTYIFFSSPFPLSSIVVKKIDFFNNSLNTKPND